MEILGWVRATTADNFPIGKLLGMEVDLPPIEEQRRIAAILDHAVTLRIKRQVAVDLLDLLPGRLFASMPSEPASRLPLGNLIASTQLGLVRSARQLGTEGTFEYVKMDAISADGRFAPTAFKKTTATEPEAAKYTVFDGDLLFNTRNTEELVGKTAIYRGPARLFNNNLLRLRFLEGVKAEYVHGFLVSDSGRKQLAARKAGTTSVFAIYARDLMTVEVPVPDLARQTKFAKRVRAAGHYRSILVKQSVEMDGMFAALQARAFAGEL